MQVLAGPPDFGDGPIWASTSDVLMLEELELFDCNSEDMVPDIQNLKRFKSVNFFSCEFKDLSGLSNLTALEDLKLADGRGKLKRLPELERLTKISITKHLLHFSLEIKTPGVAMNIITQQLNYACESSGNSYVL